MYEYTRHNIGFLVVDRIAADEHIAYKPGKGRYLMATLQKDDEELFLLKPLTYMNLSGIPVADARGVIDVDLENLIVILDDVNLPFGQLRLRKGGTDGGHHGLASIIYHLVSEEFPRLRIGIGKPDEGFPLSEYVLLNFCDNEKEDLPGIIDGAAACIDVWRREGIEAAMNFTNRKIE
jgi:PTH1 family peptidyl-tRNA hydrolase